jgi:long-subunit acyl-CoA synthetase (AMP-forming)
VGVKGEICVAGLGVGKGYWKNEKETKAVFVPNPYNKESGLADYTLMYKTGDIGYFLENGEVVCMGRIDEQLKIRGFRIEPAEIEHALLENENVKEAVVLAHHDAKNHKRLVAFIVLSNYSLMIQDIRQFLKNKLPDYMIPSYFIKVDSIPLTINGKADKKMLARKLLVLDRAEENYIEPATTVEKQVAEIWKEVLGIEFIGLNDTFFDLGGHSLLLIRSNQRIKNQFNIELPFRLYFNKSLEQIAAEINDQLQHQSPKLVVSPAGE